MDEGLLMFRGRNETSTAPRSVSGEGEAVNEHGCV